MASSMFDSNNLHHAYVIEGDQETAFLEITKFLHTELGVSILGNPDIFLRRYESFGIEDSREVKEFMQEKALGTYKIFLLGIPSMTHQSGNALLKALEEPPSGTHFFIVVPNSKRLLPTLLSRVVLIPFESDENSKSAIELSPTDFLKFSSDKRMEEVKNILGLYDKEKIAKLDIILFLKEVIEMYHMKKNFKPEVLKNAITALDYAADSSSSLKIILEYVALVLV